LQVGAKTTHAQTELKARMEVEGIKLGMQGAKQRQEAARAQRPQPSQPPKKETR